MHGNLKRFGLYAGGAAVAALLPLALLGPVTGTLTAAAQRPVSGLRMVPAIGQDPLYVRAGQVTPGTTTFSCQAPESATNPIPCYGPQQIRAAYDVPSNLTGAGRTIVIIDAFGSPTIVNDLQVFDSVFGLPNPTFNILNPYGAVFDPTNPDDVGWSSETSLDVEWAHAIAPGATIDLVLAKTDADSDILAAQQYVVDHDLGDVLSQSFGEGETCMLPSIRAAQHQAFEQAAAEGISVFASAGDEGSAQPDCNGDGNDFLSAATPASDPSVTGVGGTTLNADYATGAYQSESVWNDSGESPDFGAGGGGFSTLNREPLYQILSQHSGARGVPDVSYDGDVYGGVLGVWSSSGLGADLVFIFGGTSAGSPQWAAITALADQAAGHRLGFLNPALYAIAAVPGLYRYAFHDVTTGNNLWDGSGITTGYSAGPRWDAASGLGSPDAAHLIQLLAR